MEKFLDRAAWMVLIFLIAAAVLGEGRLFVKEAAPTTPVTVHEAAPGISCATMGAGDSAAISCWKE